MDIIKIISWKYINESLIADIREIYELSFPEDERRDFDKVMLLEDNAMFSFYYATGENDLVGFYTQWTFDDCNYIEHLAIKESYRGKGYGTELINNIKNANKLIVLEVEKPGTDDADKRITFYLRLGFNLCVFPYMQPPYSPEKGTVAMNFMTCPNTITYNEFITIRDLLYRNVYNFEEKRNY